MNKQEKKDLVPELRFPEFVDSGEWKNTVLQNIGNFVGGGTPSTSSPEYWGGNIQWFTPSEIKERYLSKSKRTITDLGLKKSSAKLLPKGALLISTRATVGDVGISTAACATNQGFQSLLVKESESHLFWYYWITKHKNILISKSSGSTFIEIGKNEIKKINVTRPEKNEQKKIADFLSSIDDFIISQTQKLEALKAHKKGLMQQLFPAEEETVPKLRFPEFRQAGEWKKRTLGEFLTERNQSPIRELPLFSLTIEDGITPKRERYERSFLVKDKEVAYKLVCPDDFAYNPMNLRFGAIARHTGTDKVALSKYYNIFYCDDSVDSRFCDIYFRSYGMIIHYDNVATGSLIEKRRVHFKDFLKFKIPFPTLEEQQKVADIIGSIDDLITTQNKKIEFYKAHKKGLTQKLFPAVDEVSL